MAKKGAESGAKCWPFWVSGSALAFLTVLSLYLFNDSVGLGDAMTMASEHCVEGVTDQDWDALPLDWQLGILLGIILGTIGTAALSGWYKPRFSDGEGSVARRMVMTPLLGILGGFMMMTGIQLSGESVFGHFAAGLQLSGGAWIFLIAMAVSAVLLAALCAQRGGGKTAAPAGSSGGKKDKPAPKAAKKKGGK